MNETVDEARADEGISLNDDSYEGYWQEEREPEKPVLRGQAMILLVVILLPTLLILIEVLTGGITTLVHTTKTAIPNLLPSVHF